jgi:hypothetical protein
MKRLNLFSILFTLMLLLLVPNLTAASLSAETTEIPYQINNSDRIAIGTVSEIHTYETYTRYSISIQEWLYNPLPMKTIEVESKIGSNLWVEDQVEFAKNESALIMLEDVNLNKQLFSVTFGFPGKHPIFDRDAVIKELKIQGKWSEENQIENKTNEAKKIENAELLGKQKENQTENKTNNTGMTENTGTTGKKGENTNNNQKSNVTPFMSPICIIASMIGAIVYVKRKQ